MGNIKNNTVGFLGIEPYAAIPRFIDGTLFSAAHEVFGSSYEFLDELKEEIPIIATYYRLSGELWKDLKGGTTQAIAGVVALVGEGVESLDQTVKIVPRIAEKVLPVATKQAFRVTSRILEKGALPCVILGGVAQIYNSIKARDYGGALYAEGSLFGGLCGEVIAGAFLGAFVSFTVVPGVLIFVPDALVTSIACGIFGGYVGGKVAKKYLAAGLARCMGAKESDDRSPAQALGQQPWKRRSYKTLHHTLNAGCFKRKPFHPHPRHPRRAENVSEQIS
jgi:hypothetical protein